MCTSYGASWQSKNEYIGEELEALGKALGHKTSLTDKVITTNAAIEGQRDAFPKCDEMNAWFKGVAKACLNADKELVTWQTPTGSTIWQEYREPITKRVVTYGMGGARYHRPSKMSDGNTRDTNRSSTSVRVGWGEVKESKTQTAFAANWTHSMDAAIIQMAFNDYQHSFFAVHDCGYAPAGCVDDMVTSLRKAYLAVVTSTAMEDLPASNGVKVAMPLKGDVNITDCLNSDYMFS